MIGMINLLEVMEMHNVYTMVFSSSCTVYGEPEKLPISEQNETGRKITNVYGKTKYFIEQMLGDISHSNEKWNIIALRYFNPVGAHSSGLIGEDPTKQFTNLMPYISQVAMGKKESLTIFGDDYDTPDGTGKFKNKIIFKVKKCNCLFQEFETIFMLWIWQMVMWPHWKNCAVNI